MVLRSSPWESRTSLTNKGHFLSSRAGPGRAPFSGRDVLIPWISVQIPGFSKFFPANI